MPLTLSQQLPRISIPKGANWNVDLAAECFLFFSSASASGFSPQGAVASSLAYTTLTICML
jgi:hypothetical protein